MRQRDEEKKRQLAKEAAAAVAKKAAKKADEPMADPAEPRRSTRNKPTASQADKLVDDTTIQTDPVTDTVMTEDDQPQLPPAMPQQLPPPSMSASPSASASSSTPAVSLSRPRLLDAAGLSSSESDESESSVMTEDDQPQLPPAMPQQLPPPVPPAQQPTSWRNWLPLSSLLSGQQSSGEIEEFD